MKISFPSQLLGKPNHQITTSCVPRKLGNHGIFSCNTNWVAYDVQCRQVFLALGLVIPKVSHSCATWNSHGLSCTNNTNAKWQVLFIENKRVPKLWFLHYLFWVLRLNFLQVSSYIFLNIPNWNVVLKRKGKFVKLWSSKNQLIISISIVECNA
jgi:hypothetical protein